MEKNVQRSLTGLESRRDSGRDSVRTQDSGAGFSLLRKAGARLSLRARRWRGAGSAETRRSRGARVGAGPAEVRAGASRWGRGALRSRRATGPPQPPGIRPGNLEGGASPGGGRTPAWRRAGPAPRAGAAVSDRGGSRLPRGPAWRSRCLPASPLRRGAPCPRAQGGRRVGSAATARARGAARVFPAGPARPRRFRGVRSAGRRCESWLAVLNFFVPLRKLQSLSSLSVK